MVDLEEMDELSIKFYEDYISFNTFIEFRMVDLQKTYKGRHPMISKYASNIQEVQEIFKEYQDDRWIVYVGCNPRAYKKKTDNSVKERRTFFFDIEMDGYKPPLSDEDYYNKLISTASYISKSLKKIGLNPNLLLESGRGLHLGFKMIPMNRETYDGRFKLWLKSKVKELMKNRPFEDIKFDDAMQNASRIESAPPFIHHKYPEKPKRKILRLYDHENNLHPHMNRVKVKEIKVKRDFPNYRSKYNDRTFFKSPEWLMIANNQDLPEGDIHNKILFQIKIMVRDHNINKELVQMELAKLGYDEVVDTPPPEAQYNPWTIFHWCMKHAKYCLDRKIIPTYPFKKDMYFVKGIEEEFPFSDYKGRELADFKDVLRFIKEFNRDTAFRTSGEKVVVFQSILWRKIKNGLKDNPHLYDYMMFLNLPEHISGKFSYLISDGGNYESE